MKDCIEKTEVEKALAQQENIKILDVRSTDEYAQLHIQEAIHLELKDIHLQLHKLNKNYRYITVCGKGGGRSADAARILQNAGFNAAWLCGGTYEWIGKTDI
ncbi:MAG TPA: rhodanese-like domain-containing protein [Chitinophagales bacterium]|jgi:rhodanese-related sulfurtransferase|nr:rhodanese-like domain-containing protein [Chitinophagales bacterium]HQO89081.1 rhodanese-like domain-containing protein [Chitinophagales bacterium]